MRRRGSPFGRSTTHNSMPLVCVRVNAKCFPFVDQAVALWSAAGADVTQNPFWPSLYANLIGIVFKWIGTEVLAVQLVQVGMWLACAALLFKIALCMSRTPAAALLRSAKPKAIENNTVILSFKFPLHKENMEKTDNQQIAEQIISNFLGRACRVRCIYEPEANHLIEEALKIGAQIIESEEK